MTTIFGFVKGVGVQPISNKQAPVLLDVPVSPSSSAATAATTVGSVQCAVEGCGRQFKKLQPMALNHFRAKHADLDDGKDSWKRYLKET